MATFEQVRELRWLRKNGIDAMPTRCEELDDEAVADLRFLYGAMRDENLIDGLLFADDIPYFAHVTPKGKRESSLPRLAAKAAPVALRAAVAALRGLLAGAACLGILWAALHASSLSSVVQAM